MASPGKRSQPNQAVLAKMLGVSQYTISLALRNSPSISEARRTEIQQLARKHGYRLNPVASALAQSKKQIVPGDYREALAWLNFWKDPKEMHTWREFKEYWTAAKACAEEYGYRLEEFSTRDTSLPRLEKQLLARGIHGIILPPLGGATVDIRPFNWSQFSVVRLGLPLREPGFHSVGPDSVFNAICAFNEIRQRGYRRIGFLGFHDGKRHTLHAFLGSQQLIPTKERVPPFLMPGDPVEKFEPSFQRWLKRYRPDAIFSEVNHISTMLTRAGLQIPSDVAVAAATVLDIPKVDAGIYQNGLEIGRVAVLLLLSLLRENDRGYPEHSREIMIRGKWVDGKTLPHVSSTAK